MGRSNGNRGFEPVLILLSVGVLVIQVAGRLGAMPIASAVAACVFLVAVPSTECWLLLAPVKE